jgi:outer membrane lipoprotein-sorting protein
MFVLCLFVSIGADASVDSKLVSNAEKYLNSITGLNGKFIQTSNGRQENGIFSM